VERIGLFGELGGEEATWEGSGRASGGTASRAGAAHSNSQAGTNNSTRHIIEAFLGGLKGKPCWKPCSLFLLIPACRFGGVYPFQPCSWEGRGGGERAGSAGKKTVILMIPNPVRSQPV
jgi:hypothetical protein